MEYNLQDNELTIFLSGRITSANAEDIRQDIDAILQGKTFDKLILDADELEYISSAGLRVVFSLMHAYSNLTIINASLDVYDIFEMTGFTKIVKVRRKLIEVDVSGMQVIGEGRTGIVYRMDKDTILKVYKRDVSVEDIEREMELSRESFILGIPTAITFDIVKVGTHLASRFEMLDCDTLAEVIAKDIDHLDVYLDQYAELLKKINSTSSNDLELPDRKKKWIEHASLCLPHLDQARGKKLMDMMNAIPEVKTFVHGDCHIKNIMSDGKSLFLIDMGALSTGYPLFDLAPLYRTFFGFDFVDHGNTERFLELPRDVLDRLYFGLMERYFGTFDQATQDKLALAGLVYLVSWSSRYENNPKRIEDGARRLGELIDRVDSLILPLKD